MLGDMEIVHCAQRDAPTMRRLSVDMTNAQKEGMTSLRRLSTSSVSSSLSCQSNSPTFSSSLPNTHSFWPEKMSNLFRTTSMPVREPSHQQLQSTPEMKMPALLRSLSKGMDAFR